MLFAYRDATGEEKLNVKFEPGELRDAAKSFAEGMFCKRLHNYFIVRYTNAVVVFSPYGHWGSKRTVYIFVYEIVVLSLGIFFYLIHVERKAYRDSEYLFLMIVIIFLK